MQRSYGTLTAGRVIAELTFGDWVRLLGTGGRRNVISVDYVKLLWRPWLSVRFAGAKDRKDMHNRAETISRFRNRSPTTNRSSLSIWPPRTRRWSTSQRS